MSVEAPKKSLIDPNNGFTRVYEAETRRLHYSLVLVPPNRYFRSEYVKPAANIAFCLELTDESNDDLRWNVHGTIDSDIFCNLGFKAQSQRQKNSVPVISPDNLRSARNYGEIDELEASFETHLPLFRVNLILEHYQVDKFFRAVWRPDGSPEISQVPAIITGSKPDESRILPQKMPQEGLKSLASLIVYHEWQKPEQINDRFEKIVFDFTA